MCLWAARKWCFSEWLFSWSRTEGKILLPEKDSRSFHQRQDFPLHNFSIISSFFVSLSVDNTGLMLLSSQVCVELRCDPVVGTTSTPSFHCTAPVVFSGGTTWSGLCKLSCYLCSVVLFCLKGLTYSQSLVFSLTKCFFHHWSNAHSDQFHGALHCVLL